MRQTGLYVGVGNLLQLLAHRRDGADRGQTFFRVVVVPLEVFLHERVEQRMAVGGQGVVRDENLTERLGFIKHPGMHGPDQGVTVDEVHLHGQDAVQQVAVGGGSGMSGVRHGGLLMCISRTWQRSNGCA
jgi:hypothetical protein